MFGMKRIRVGTGLLIWASEQNDSGIDLSD